MQVPLASGGTDISARAVADATSSKLAARAERLARAEPGAAEEAESAGREMEALFATLLVKEMRRALPEGGFFGAGIGADTFNGWMDEFMGAELAEAGALELAGMVKAALTDKSAADDEAAR